MDNKNCNSNNIVDQVTTRHEKSLGVLTTRFVSLIQNAKDGLLSLNEAADILAVKQKRRIYDITNVLEGIGLIEKKPKNLFQWIEAGPGCDNREKTEELLKFKQKLKDLENKEIEIDKQLALAKQSILNITNEKDYKANLWIEHKHLRNSFPDNTLLSIREPIGLHLEVHLPKSKLVAPSAKKIALHLKSRNRPIEIYLVNKYFETNEANVLSMPVDDANALLPFTIGASERESYEKSNEDKDKANEYLDDQDVDSEEDEVYSDSEEQQDANEYVR